jgi:hypothetical protein
MENFSASHDRGWEVITETIDLSDYYVLILAGRYGSIDPTVDMSWTEREYHYAVKQGIPVLAFLRDKAYITADNMDLDEKATRLATFVGAVEKKHKRDTWTTDVDLQRNVGRALSNEIQRDERRNKPRPGWYRGNRLPPTIAEEEIGHLTAENRALRTELRVLKAFTMFDPGVFFGLESAVQNCFKSINVAVEKLVDPIGDDILRYISGNSDAHLALRQLMNYIENYAEAVRVGVIDGEVAYHRMSEVVIRWHRVLSPFIALLRKERAYPEIGQEMEWLAGQWRERHES